MRKYIAIIIASLALYGAGARPAMSAEDAGHRGEGDMADGFNLGNRTAGTVSGRLSPPTRKGNKWVFGGEYLLKNNPTRTKIPVAQFTAEGGYYFKNTSDARKIVFVYAGLRLSPDMNR